MLETIVCCRDFGIVIMSDSTEKLDATRRNLVENLEKFILSVNLSFFDYFERILRENSFLRERNTHL